MASKVALVTDSTSNLPLDLAASRHIHVVPLYVIWDEVSLKEGVDIQASDLFRRLAASPDIPKTSQASPQDFVDILRRAREMEGADEVVCPVISCDLSGTYASAMQAKELVDFPVHVVDTRLTTWGLGFAALAAADARDTGASARDIVEAIKDAASRTHVYFTIESLEYIHRGGRIGNASRLLGSALNIKPVLELREGIVHPVDKVRTRKRVVDHLLKVAEAFAGEKSVVRLATIHGDAEQEAVDLLERAAVRLSPREKYASYATAAIGVHVGPGALGIIIERSA
jgi:DegV family protein with EDD domain